MGCSTEGSGALLLLLLLCSCREDEPPADGGPPVPELEPPVDSEVEGPTGDTGAGSTGDTGPLVAQPPCTGLAEAQCVHLSGDEEADLAGKWVDVADIDGDGLAEVAVAEPYYGPYPSPGVHAAIHLLEAPSESGLLRDRATASFLEMDDQSFTIWGDTFALLPEVGQVAVNGLNSEDLNTSVYDVLAAGGVAHAEVVGGVIQDDSARNLGWGMAASACVNDAGAALCITTNSVDDLGGGIQDYAGQIFVFDAPLLGTVEAREARSQIQGDDGNRVIKVGGDDDLDGDGVTDLMAGAIFGGPAYLGQVAVLYAIPDGVHRVWDVAGATLVSDGPNYELGKSMTSGDLDGDGLADALASAPLGIDGEVYGFRSPVAGERSVVSAEWSFVDAVGVGDWMGLSITVGDFDGDGASDVAAGAPLPYTSDDGPGAVFLWLGPTQGVHEAAQADRVLASGLGVFDQFGASIDAGDLDGDGRDDLVVGAPYDSTAGLFAGAAYVLYGAGL